MNNHRPAPRGALAVLVVSAVTVLGCGDVWAQCTAQEVTSGLRSPLGITGSTQGHLLVAETGNGTTNSGRVSIIDIDGTRRTLLDGLPSGPNDVGGPSGPAGLIMRGRTLFVLIGIGDAGLPGPAPLTLLDNPHPSSPIFSSLLAIHFSAAVEKRTSGFALTSADQQALAAGQMVQLSNESGDRVEIEVMVDFPDLIPAPLPDLPTNVRGSNPYGIAAIGKYLYVTDGGRNLVWWVDSADGSFGVLASFPQIPNPLPFGPTMTDAVPTGIRADRDSLLVTLFGGFPFAPGASVLLRVDPATGTYGTVAAGLTSAIDVLPRPPNDGYLVLQFASQPILGGPGQLVDIAVDGTVSEISGCLIAPSAMVQDEKSGQVYVTELVGQLVVIP